MAKRLLEHDNEITKKNKLNEYIYYKPITNKSPCICPLCLNIIYENDERYGIICNSEQYKQINSGTCFNCGTMILDSFIEKNIEQIKYEDCEDVYKIVGKSKKLELPNPFYYYYYRDSTIIMPWNCEQCNCYMPIDTKCKVIFCHRQDKKKYHGISCVECGNKLQESFLKLNNIKARIHRDDYQTSVAVGNNPIGDYFCYTDERTHDNNFFCPKCGGFVKKGHVYCRIICHYKEQYINDSTCYNCYKEIKEICEKQNITLKPLTDQNTIFFYTGKFENNPQFPKFEKVVFKLEWSAYSTTKHPLGATFTCSDCGMYHNGFANPYEPCWKASLVEKHTGQTANGVFCRNCIGKY